MSEFFKLLAAFVLGGILTPYFSHFLLIKKTRQELRLKCLEEAYELSRKLKDHISQVPLFAMCWISFNERQMRKEDFPQFIESPISRLITLLDYHLSAEADLIQLIESLHIETQAFLRPVAEAMNNPSNKNQFYLNATSLAVEVAEKGPARVDEVIQWIREEKNKVESDPTPFHAVYWKNTWIKFCKNTHKFYANARTNK